MTSISSPLRAQESTNVRSTHHGPPPWLRAGVTVLDRISPRLSAAIADVLFFRPPRLRAPAREAAWLAQAERRVLRIGGRRIVVYAWGHGPAVLLVHGWAGRAGQMGGIATALATAGYRALAFDAPGHGASEGRSVAMPDFVEVIVRLALEQGGLHGIVGHSMGGAATMVALAQGVSAERMVVLGTPSVLEGVVESFARTLGLSKAAERLFAARLERRFGADIWQRFSPARLAPELHLPGLVVHDDADAEVAPTRARVLAAALPNATLFPTRGLGHTRMLRESVVVDRIVEAMAAESSAANGMDTASA